jgi:hypothetical protein
VGVEGPYRPDCQFCTLIDGSVTDEVVDEVVDVVLDGRMVGDYPLCLFGNSHVLAFIVDVLDESDQFL